MRPLSNSLDYLIRSINANRNLHFWVLVNNAPVKITLKPGLKLGHHQSRETDEGCETVSHVWSHEIDFIKEIYVDRGQDCDGLHEFSSEQTCKPHEIKDRNDEGRLGLPRAVSGNNQDHPAAHDG